MNTMPPHSYKNFIIGITITTGAGLCLIVTSFIIGKNEFFLLLNNDLGTAADYFFRFWTNIGDGVVWILVAFLFFRYRKNKLPLLISVFLFSTLITQLTKKFAYPEITRPTVSIRNTQLIHTVPGVELLSANSFPSGHTATAFCFFLLACLLVKKNWIIPVGFICALLVGYSRIYLAEHFPLDVGAGMMTAVITVLLSIAIQKRWEK